MRDFFNYYKNFMLVQFSIALLFRILFFFLNDLTKISWLFQGIGFDILFCLALYGILSPFSYLFFKISKKISQGFQFAILLLLFIVQYATEIFYHTQNTLLGKSVLFYSIDDLKTIADSGESNLKIAISMSIISLVLVIGVLRFVKTRQIIWIKLFISIFAAVTLAQFLTQNLFFGSNADSANAVQSKPAYFLNGILTELVSSKDINLDGNFKFREGFENRTYLDTLYPFLFEEELTRSNLSPFFEHSEIPPSIVFIVVESLSRYISGAHSTYPSLTPFLDSLSQKSLVWNNCISSSERTFGILPGLLGSLPYGRNGFTFMAGKMPRHISLINVLEQNGYKSNFYYGGNPSFDNTDIFLNRERFDNIESEDYIRKNGKVYWGLTDSLTFQKSLKNYNSLDPQIHVYLTLSTHGPFDFEGIERINKYLNVSYPPTAENEVFRLKDEETPNLLASFYYVDQQIKHLMNGLKRTPNYRNTIFIITGDHGLPLDRNKHSLKNYHVPFIIHSPLLTRTKSMDALVSHLDVYPSLKKLLRSNYGVETPTISHDIGQDLDTISTFHCNRQIPLISGDKSIDGIVKDSLVLYRGSLYQIHSNLNVFTKKSLVDQKKAMSQELESFKTMDQYACFNDMLVPEIYSKNWITNYRMVDAAAQSIEKTSAEFIGIKSLKNIDKGIYIKIIVELTFVNLDFDRASLPDVILSLDSDNESILYTKKKIFELHEQLETENLRKTIAIEAFIPNSTKENTPYNLSIYLWNRALIEVPITTFEYEFYTEL